MVLGFPHYLRALDITCAEVTHAPDRSDQICDLITATDTVDLVVVVGATRHGPADHLRRRHLDSVCFDGGLPDRASHRSRSLGGQAG
jgi:molybdopterin biosynthesis enzyme